MSTCFLLRSVSEYEILPNYSRIHLSKLENQHALKITLQNLFMIPKGTYQINKNHMRFMIETEMKRLTDYRQHADPNELIKIIFNFIQDLIVFNDAKIGHSLC